MHLAQCGWMTRSKEAKVLPPIVRTRIRSCGKQFRDRSCRKNCPESFRDFHFCKFEIFEISVFANFNFFVLPRPACPPPGDRDGTGVQKSLGDLCETLTRKASQTCTYVPFTGRTLCCRCAVLLKTGTQCRQTSLHRPRYPQPTIRQPIDLLESIHHV
jgi:hypothetical protein